MMMWEFADWKKRLEHFTMFHDFIGRAEDSLLRPAAADR